MVGTTLVVELVRKSVLQCFCRTCQAAAIEKKPPLPKKNNAPTVKTRPPKKVIFLATEVRASEQSKGGMKYELLLADPTANCPTQRPSSPPKTNLSVEDIQNKLKAAEERRLSIEAQKLSQLIEKRSRLNEVNQKKQEYNNNFMQTAREILEQKTEAYKENREAHLKSIQEKLREHRKHVLQVRQLNELNEKDTGDKLERICRKLDEAETKRLIQLQALQERLQEHERHIEEVRQQKAQYAVAVTNTSG